MDLAVFDIDGTLVRSEPADTALFVRAFEVAFAIRDIESDWSKYPHCTDSWITAQVLRERLGREPAEHEVARCREVFVELLREAQSCDPTTLEEIPGASAALRRLARDGWSVAIATGGWRASALFKLAAVGIDGAALPGAFADDHGSREGIVALARSRAEAAYGHPAGRAVYVGDAVWDGRTCSALGMPFVGVGSGARAERLRAAGAVTVLPDLSALDSLRRALEAARTPTA